MASLPDSAQPSWTVSEPLFPRLLQPLDGLVKLVEPRFVLLAKRRDGLVDGNGPELLRARVLHFDQSARFEDARRRKRACEARRTVRRSV